MGKKHKDPKTKKISYGGKKLPIVESPSGEFYLADREYDNLGHGSFQGQETGKLEGPSRRAIKGRGKGAKNVRVYNKGGDAIFLQDTSPAKQKYSSQSGMESAVKRWQSPHKLTANSMSPMQDNGTFDYGQKSSDLQKKYKKTSKKEAEEAGVGYRSEKKIERQAKRDEKKAYMQTDEGKAERRAKATDTVQALGRAMMAYAGLKPGEAGDSAVDKLKKEKEKENKPSEEASNTKTDLHTSDSGDVLVDNKKDKKSSMNRRGDIEAMSAIMRKIKNPRKVVKEKISGSEFRAGVDKEGDAFTGTKKTITKGDKTVVKTKKKGAKGDWKEKTKKKTVGDKHGDGKSKHVEKTKYNRKASEKDPTKTKKRKKFKEVYKEGSKTKEREKTKRVSDTQKSKGTMKDGVWKGSVKLKKSKKEKK